MLRRSISGRDRAAWDRLNHGRLQAARLINSQNGGFILDKFQYVACVCNVDCNVTRGHGFCYQKHKNPLLDEGGFQYLGIGPCRDLESSPGISPIMGRGATSCLGDRGPRGRVSEGILPPLSL